MDSSPNQPIPNQSSNNSQPQPNPNYQFNNLFQNLQKQNQIPQPINQQQESHSKHNHQQSNHDQQSNQQSQLGSSFPSSSSPPSSQSNQQKWQYQSIKQVQQNKPHQSHKQVPLGQNQVSKQNNQQKNTKIVRYKYCCKRCKHADRDKDKKACVCVVPRQQRRTHLGNQGCQTCGCIGCSRQDFIHRGQDPEYHPEDDKKKQNKIKQQQRFQARNGCCKNCMKAFSKSGKSCICQVPDQVRKTKLSITGCKICGCKGCNPEDKKTPHKPQKRVRRSRSRSEKRQKRDRHEKEKQKKRRSRSRQPEIIDTYAMNFYNVDRSIIGSMIINEYQIDPALLGFGVPQRSSSYLSGKF